MSLDKSIEHGKEKRKEYRGSKAIDRTCRNHGSCLWCLDDRLYKFRDKRPILDEDFGNGGDGLRITSKEQLQEFLSIVDKCERAVYLVSDEGDRFNLKSTLMEYVGIGRLLEDHEEKLELFCDSKNDETLFLKFFHENPEVL